MLLFTPDEAFEAHTTSTPLCNEVWHGLQPRHHDGEADDDSTDSEVLSSSKRFCLYLDEVESSTFQAAHKLAHSNMSKMGHHHLCKNHFQNNAAEMRGFVPGGARAQEKAW